jgi:hypothetical protein
MLLVDRVFDLMMENSVIQTVGKTANSPLKFNFLIAF